MLVAHLSDLHLTSEEDAVWLDRQLDRIVRRRADHLVITGDVLDRWSPALAARALDALEARGLLDARRSTILHGNHDLASSGGHPRRHADLVRLALRAWDPPPLVRWRRRRFYELVERRAAGVARPAPHLKSIDGARFAVLDTIPLAWRPVRLDGGVLTVPHAIGCVRERQARWLATLPSDPRPLILLVHHYPLDTAGFEWMAPRNWRLPVRRVRVPMAIDETGRRALWESASRAGVRLVLCGHVHRARLEWCEDIAVGLNGQSGAAWAGRTIAYYEVGGDRPRVEYERV